MGVGLSPVYLQFRVVYHDHLVCAVLRQLVGQVFHLIADENRHYLCLQTGSQLLSFSQQFVCDTADLIVHLLGKHIYAFIFF